MRVPSYSLLPALALLVTSCQSAPTISQANAGERCYSGFVSEMSTLVPSDAEKCGIFSAHESSSTLDCAKAAVKSQKPFLFGYQSFGDDSMYCHAAARDSTGQILNIFYDAGMVATGDKYAFIQISRCKAIEFRPGTIGIGSFFDTEGCTDAPDLVQAIVARRHGE